MLATDICTSMFDVYLDDSVPHIGQGDFAIPIHIQYLEGLWNLFWRHEELQVHRYNEVSAPQCMFLLQTLRIPCH